MANIAETHWAETMELVHWKLLAWIAVVGILPAVAAARIALRPIPRWPSLWQPVVTFLALLELIRLKQIVAVQAQEFGDIEIEKAHIPSLSPTGGEDHGEGEAEATTAN